MQSGSNLFGRVVCESIKGMLLNSESESMKYVMKPNIEKWRFIRFPSVEPRSRWFVFVAVFMVNTAVTTICQASNISAFESFAVSENAGWINFNPIHGGITVHDTYLSGFAWAEGVGWIKFGSENGGPYGNTDATNWGVNLDRLGKLTGYAWGENSGWLTFSPKDSVTGIIPETGIFSGYAWSESIGYVSLSALAGYGVRRIAPGEMSSSANFAWGENSGWFNLQTRHGGVTVHATHLSGWAWSEGAGWIKLGADGSGPYTNTGSDNWGVNYDSSSGLLTGFGWSEASGWVNFNPNHGQVVIDSVNGVFSGYAWGEGIGWVGFGPSSLYTVRYYHDADGDGVNVLDDNCPENSNANQADHDADGTGDVCDAFPQNPSYSQDTDSDGIADEWENQNFNNDLTVANATSDYDGDGLLDIAEFMINSDPLTPHVVISSGVPVDLNEGFNLVSILPASGQNYTAYGLLAAIGDKDVISSIQRFNPLNGSFETASYNETGQLSGVDFWVVPGEGYIIYMITGIQGFTP